MVLILRTVRFTQYTGCLLAEMPRLTVCTGLLAPLGAGGVVVLPSAGRFTAHSFWTDCVHYGATFYTAVPTIHQV